MSPVLDRGAGGDGGAAGRRARPARRWRAPAPAGLRRWGPQAESCGSCAWRYQGGRGPAVDRCRQSAGEVGDGRRVRRRLSRPASAGSRRSTACTCGACCREAYHSVSVSMRDPVVWKQPGLIVRDGHRWSLLRAGDRCAALERRRRQPAPGSATTAASTRIARAPAASSSRAGATAWSARRRVGSVAADGREHRRSSFVPLAEARRAAGRRWRRARWARPRPAGAGAGAAALAGRAQGTAAGLQPAPGASARPRERRRREPPAPALAGGRPAPRVVIIGSGPAGTFAALRLAEAGVPATILERGKPVQPRRHDLAQLTRGRARPRLELLLRRGRRGHVQRRQALHAQQTRGRWRRVLADLVRFGAPPEIPVEARPHVGSNRLPKVLTALREHLEGAGRRATASRPRRPGCASRAGGCARCACAGGDEMAADAVVLATGHSARAVYDWLRAAGVASSARTSRWACASSTRSR